jgi:adenylate cyclase
VLDGLMGRGRSASLRAGIAFIDIRDFTSLSHSLGVSNILPLLNAVFESIDDAIRPEGGEILKLIGDGALVVFPLGEGDDARLLSILRTLLDAAVSATAATTALGRPLHVGVGFHIGDVLYGNVGSKDRHDFTVMGPAVNLASRLEILTKLLGAEEALDAAVRLKDPVRVRGVPEPVSVWTITR